MKPSGQPSTTIGLLYLLTTSLIIGFTSAIDPTRNATLDASLKTAATQLDRLALLSSSSDWVFDFTAQPQYTYSPGGVVNANAATFPATVGNGMTMAMLYLGACSMLPPHYHPRATNYVVAVEGNTTTYMIEENGARLVTESLTPGKMTIFPMGSLHSMQNQGCGNATLVSALNSEDQGTHNVANGLFNFPPDIIAAAFGNTGVFANFANLSSILGGIPTVGTGAALGSAECLARCGML